MDDKCKRCMNREEICNNSMRILCKRNGFDAFSPVTNADKYFHYATDEEIAKWIRRHDCHTNLYGYDNEEAILDWLKQEAEE